MKKSCYIIALVLLGSGAHASETNYMSMSLKADTLFEVKTAKDRSNLYLTAEGTAKFESSKNRVYAYARCAAVDTIVEGHHSVYAGVGDCHFTSPSGGVLYGTFKTPEGRGDRGFMVLSNGTGDLAGFSGSEIPLIARVNPRMTGKPVFHFDNTEKKNINE